MQRATGIALPRDSAYVSLSGLFLHQLQRLPQAGDSIQVDGWQLDVLDLERRRVGRARLSPVPAS